MAQDTERTRPQYDAEIIKEIFIAVQTETMNFINIVDRNNEDRIQWTDYSGSVNNKYRDLGVEFEGENCGVVLSLKDTESDDSDALACHRGRKVQPCII